ncbi:MAG: ABC transporter permease [Lactobacillus sp.]
MIATYRVTLRSVSTFDNLRLIVLNYLILPLVSLLLFLLIAFSARQDYARALIGTIVTTAISTEIGIITASTVYDQNIGLFDDIISIRPKFQHYWLPKFVIAGATVIVESLVLGVLGLAALGKLELFPKLILALPLIILIGALLGYLGAMWGIRHRNPYWLSNIMIGCLVILAGLIIPVSEYPLWLKPFADVFPISNILDWILSSALVNQTLAIIGLKLVVWYSICVISLKVIKEQLKNSI